MTMHAKDITVVQPPATPPPPDVSHHIRAIDAMLAKPWHPSELVDAGDQDHAGRVYPDHGALTAAECHEIERAYRAAGWEVRAASGWGRLGFVPKSDVLLRLLRCLARRQGAE